MEGDEKGLKGIVGANRCWAAEEVPIDIEGKLPSPLLTLNPSVRRIHNLSALNLG